MHTSVSSVDVIISANDTRTQIAKTIRNFT